MLAAVRGPRGLSRIDGSGQRQVDIPVVVVTTDERVLLVPESGTSDARTLAYGDLASVTVDDGVLELTMVDEVTWRAPLPTAGGAMIDQLRWIGEVRQQVIAVRNDIRLAAGTIEMDADSCDWESAEATYAEVRRQLDDLICVVQATDLPDGKLAPELTTLERTLETARGHLWICRAQEQVDLARRLIDNGDIGQAEPILRAAREGYERARNGVEAVRRSDDFQFGEQRKLDGAIDALGWEVEAVAAEPVRRAEEARLRAREVADAADAADAVGPWETALARYEALGTDPGDGPFAGDPEAIARNRDEAADGLIDCRVELARRCWNAGIACEREGDLAGALDRLTGGVAHLRHAVEVAGEYRPGRREPLDTRLGRIREAVREFRTAGVLRRRAQDGSPLGDADGPAGATAEAVAELSDRTLGYESAGDDGRIEEFTRSVRAGAAGRGS